MMFKHTTIALAILLAGCSNESTTDTVILDPDYGFNIQDDITLIEGDTIFVQIQTEDTIVAVTGSTPADVENMTIQLERFDGYAIVTMKLDYDSAPLLPHTRRFVVNGSQTITAFDVDITPTPAPDVYLLVGQSNMVGYPGDVKQPDDGAVARLTQLNVSSNDKLTWTSEAEYVSVANNTESPSIVLAENPLHEPGKTQQSIGLGMTFGKEALQNTSANIVLVPAAMGSSAFCSHSGPAGQWNVVDNEFGNTWLFDRAVVRTNTALQETGGILRGILWHQGESDSGVTECAEGYRDNLRLLAAGFRDQIQRDLTTNHNDVPFIVGTMSRGDGYAEFGVDKTLVDNAHKNVASYIPLAGVANFDDLTPINGYPCGQNGDCIHFGGDALREMGRRYNQVLNELK